MAEQLILKGTLEGHVSCRPFILQSTSNGAATTPDGDGDIEDWDR